MATQFRIEVDQDEARAKARKEEREDNGWEVVSFGEQPSIGISEVFRYDKKGEGGPVCASGLPTGSWVGVYMK